YAPRDFRGRWQAPFAGLGRCGEPGRHEDRPSPEVALLLVSPERRELMTHIHYTQVKQPPPDTTVAKEWATYVREMPRWLAEGQEGRFVLIKGDEVIGLYDTRREALDVGRQRFGLVPIMIHGILEWELVLRQGHLLRQTTPASP